VPTDVAIRLNLCKRKKTGVFAKPIHAIMFGTHRRRRCGISD
jgi:hypothetical protein